MLSELTLLLFGAAIGWIVSLYGFGVSEKANLIGDHINDLMKYSEELRLYWSKSFINDSKSQLEETIKIKSLYISVQTFYGHHASSLFSSKVLSEYQIIAQKLIYVMTAGDFEKLERDSNESKAIETQQLAWELIQILRRERQKQYHLISPLRMLIRGIGRIGSMEHR